MRFLVAFFMMTSLALAGEEVLVEEAVMTKGIICDTQSEVAEILLVIDGDNEPGEIPGCGMLRSPQPVRATAVGTMTTSKFKYLLVRYDFLLDNSVQYGVFKRLPLPTAL